MSAGSRTQQDGRRHQDRHGCCGLPCVVPALPRGRRFHVWFRCSPSSAFRVPSELSKHTHTTQADGAYSHKAQWSGLTFVMLALLPFFLPSFFVQQRVSGVGHYRWCTPLKINWLSKGAE